MLLVEAVISAVAIATGLVFVSRSLSGQLRALKRVEESATLVALAEAKLREVEAACPLQAVPAPPPQLVGNFAEPFEAYEWELTTASMADQRADEMPLSTVTVAVRRAGTGTAALRLSMPWLTAWTEEWQ